MKAGDVATLATVLNPLFNVRSAAIFDSASSVTAQATPEKPPAALNIPITFSRYEAGAIDLSIGGPVPAGSALVVSENYYPGWKATVDGKAVELSRADYTLIGLPLPPNAKDVQLRFTSAPYERGKLITIIALLLSLGAIVAGKLFDRKHSAPKITA